MSKWSLAIATVMTMLMLILIREGRFAAQDAVLLMDKQTAAVVEMEAEETVDRPLSIMAFGDVMLGRYVRTLMEKHGKDYIFANLKMTDEPFWGGADYLFANLEGPIFGEGYRHQTAMRFGFHWDSAQFLKDYGFNLLSIVNNHALDQGWEGRDETIRLLEEQGIGWCGHPTEPAVESAYYSQDKDYSMAMLCFENAIYKLDQDGAVELVRQLDGKYDFVVVSIHWGYEYQHTANAKAQVELAHKLIDAGADLIIGHHPHVVQNFEFYNGKMIFYSLGNFVFDQYWAQNVQEELGVRFELSRENGYQKTVAELYPLRSIKTQIRQMTAEEEGKWLERFKGYGKYSEEIQRQIEEKRLELVEG